MNEMVMHTGEVSAVKAIFSGRCPTCRKGDVFFNPWYHWDFLATRDNCPVCNTAYQPEPGFFYGALYVSYSFNVATLVAVSLFLWVIFDPESAWTYVFAIVGVTIATIPLTTRMSRMLWMYLFGPFKYDPTIAQRGQQG
jgi:uncharacterized protein (DUF983 family)